MLIHELFFLLGCTTQRTLLWLSSASYDVRPADTNKRCGKRDEKETE